MASFGQGFAQGMASGAATANNIIGTYQKAKLFNQMQDDRTQKGKLLQAYYNSLNPENMQSVPQMQDVSSLPSIGGANENMMAPPQTQNVMQLQNLKNEIDYGEREKQSIQNQFANASVGDMTQFIVDSFKQNGGKVNDQTYALAQGVASQLFDLKQKDFELEKKKGLFTQQIEKLKAQQEKEKTLKKYYEHQANAPYSREGKLFTDFGIPKTEDNLRLFASSKKGYTTTEIGRLIEERNKYPKGSAEWNAYNGRIKKLTTKQSDPDMIAIKKEIIALRKQAEEEKALEHKRKAGKVLSDKITYWDDLSPDQKERALSFYMKKGIIPSVKEDGWFDKTYTLDIPDESVKQSGQSQNVEDVKTINGKRYIKVNGEWFEQ